MSPRTPPILVAFAAVLAGTWAAGCVGPIHAATLVGLVAALACAVLAIRGRAPRPSFAPAAVAVLLGVLRAGVAPVPPDGLPAGIAVDVPMPARVRVAHVARRSDRGTVAVVRVHAVRDGPDWVPLEPPLAATLRHAGLLPVLAGQDAVVRGRFRPSRPPSDAVGPAWPRPSPPPTFSVSRPADWVALAGPPEPSRTDRARLELALRLRGALDGDARDLVIAVLLGEGGGIDPELREDLSALGTAHVLAVSGLHVAAAASLVGLLVYGLLGPAIVRLSPGANLVRIALGAAAVAAAGMAALAGWTPSATRAALMCVVGTAAVCIGRRQALGPLAAAAGLAGLLRDPAVAFSISFLMSYGAVFALAGLVPPLLRLAGAGGAGGDADPRRRARPARVARRVGQALAASIAATLGTLPATLLAFGVAAPAGPLVNLAVLPTAALLLMPCALLLAAVAALVPDLLPVVAAPAQAVLGTWLDAQQWLARALPSPSWVSGAWVRVLLLAGAAGFAVRLATRRTFPALVAALAAGALVAGLPRPPPVARGDFAVTFLDVGKGDATLVHCRDGQTWLVDTAEQRAALAFGGLVPTLRAFGVTRLAGILLTHADEDHVGGTLAVVRALPVGQVVTSCPAMDQEPLATILQALAAAGVPVSCRTAGDDLLPGCADATDVLWPPPGEPLQRNAASLVFRMRAGDRSILLTGDLEASEEAILLARGTDLRADVLKLGHHGSPGASSPGFLEAVSPVRAVATGIPVRGRPELSPIVQRRVAAVGTHLSRTFGRGWVRIGPWRTGEKAFRRERDPIQDRSQSKENSLTPRFGPMSQACDSFQVAGIQTFVDAWSAKFPIDAEKRVSPEGSSIRNYAKKQAKRRGSRSRPGRFRRSGESNEINVKKNYGSGPLVPVAKRIRKRYNSGESD